MADQETEVEPKPDRVAALRERMSGARTAERDDDEETNEVVVQEPAETDDDDDLEPEVPKTRDEKRAARRKQTLREEKAAAEARADVYKTELESLRSKGGTPAPQQNQNANLDRQYGEVIAEQEKLFAEYHAQRELTPAQDAEYRKRATILDIRKTSLVVDMKAAHEAPQRAQDERLKALRARNEDVWANPAALRYAEGEYNKRVARGEPDTLETHDAAAAEARQVILGKRPPPDAAQRQRATGMSGGARGSTPDAPVKLNMPPGSRMYILACARYPALDPKQACQKWANTNAKALLEASRNRGS